MCENYSYSKTHGTIGEEDDYSEVYNYNLISITTGEIFFLNIQIHLAPYRKFLIDTFQKKI